MKTADGVVVVHRRDNHMQQHQDVLPFVHEAVRKINAKSVGFLIAEVDMGRVVGANHLVSTTKSDQIVFAQREGRHGLTRFVLNREPVPCSSIVVILKRVDSFQYVLITAYVGAKAEREPWDWNFSSETERQTSVSFWSSHALVWDESSVIPNTKTLICPW